MKRFTLLATIMLAMALSVFGCSAATSKNNNTTETQVSDEIAKAAPPTKIQVAILLDTSSSMDGLIEQAKSRLWNIVNTLTTLKYKGRTPQIEIALYEYGNNGIETDDYIRQITPLTTDLDLLSEKLFALTTWGGSEYCGAVIDKAVRELNWGKKPADMKLIYIAGNEPFTQGNIPYKTAINNALEKGIYINTIHCGNNSGGINGMWKDGAEKGKGKYFNIDQNKRVTYIDTPYDAEIARCNERLNSTYLGYGHIGQSKKENQMQQDINARSISSANYAERAVSKTSKAYDNKSWDLVDKMKDNDNFLAEITHDELPTELQGKSQEEMKKVVKQKETERAAIQKEISELAQKRQAYIDGQNKKSGNEDDLGAAITSTIIEFAKSKGYIAGK